MSVLQDPVLTLNYNWQPITFMSVQTAICIAMRDQADIVDPANYIPVTFEDWSTFGRDLLRDHDWIKTASSEIAAPQIIVLKKYGKRPPRRVGFNRPNLAKRDDYVCQYCGEKLSLTKVTVDHVLPRSRGGPNKWENVVAACADCNSRKADRTPKEAGMRLRKQPSTPTWNPRLVVPQPAKAAWAPFLGKDVEEAV